MHLCQSTPFEHEQVMQLRQAVMEMAQNAIEWGNRHQSDRLVNITYRVYDDRVEIVVRDQGPGFDRSNLPHAAVARRPVLAPGRPRQARAPRRRLRAA